MLLLRNLRGRFIISALSRITILLWIYSMDSSKKFTKETRQVKLQYRNWLFPYVTKFMDKRIDSYLSLFYECELYTLEELKHDLCELLYNKQSYSVEVRTLPSSLSIEPIYKQLTLF